jgi:mannose-1-phosphate guanylyltransferase
MKAKQVPPQAVILAGGRGTRFWPRSRRQTPKQLLNIVGKASMLQQTLARLRPLFRPEQVWVVTQNEQAAAVAAQVPEVPRAQILVEPVGRNTAAAIGLAALHLHARFGDAVMAVLPADHLIADAAAFRRALRAAVALAGRPSTLVTLGIEPQWPETGYGYIERGELVGRFNGLRAYRVERFVEKPPLARARRFVASGRHSWNAGMFFWTATTYLEQLARFRPATARLLARLARAVGTSQYRRTLARLYPQLESISVDYALLEPASRARKSVTVCVIPARIGWSDVGSWAAVYNLLARKPGENISLERLVALDASGNYFWVPGRLVAAVGVRDLIVVETDDALLVCPRARAQEVGRVVEELQRRRLFRWL